MAPRSAPDTYTRPITAGEWWKTVTLPGLVEAVQVCVEGDGAIDPAALTAAIAVASQECPGARLVRRGQRWVDSGRAPEVRVAEPAGFDRTRLDSPLLRTPLTGHRSSCEVVLAQGAQGSPTTVVFRSHAGAIDRKST